jgi:hypothetical protein
MESTSVEFGRLDFDFDYFLGVLLVIEAVS